MPTLDEIIVKSETNVTSLSDKIKGLDKLHQHIESLTQQPEILAKQVQEIIASSKDYSVDLKSIATNYLDGSYNLFEAKLNELNDRIVALRTETDRLLNTDFHVLFAGLQKEMIGQTRKDLEAELKKIDEKTTDFQSKIDQFKKEINRLIDTDFTVLFRELQKAFIDQARKDIAVELNKIDDKTIKLQDKINNLNTAINRLAEIDLEKGFKDLQGKLSDIQQSLAVLPAIAQNIVSLQGTAKDGFASTNQSIRSGNESLEKTITDQNNETRKIITSLENRIQSVTEQNEQLKKEINLNKLIQLACFAATLALLIYLVARK